MSFWYWIVSRPFWLVSIAFWVVASVLVAVGDRSSKRSRNDLSAPGIIAVLLMLCWIVLAVIQAFQYAPAVIKYLSAHVVTTLSIPLAVAVLALFGVLLFVFRVYWRTRYGVAEIGFALGSIWVSASNIFAKPHDAGVWLGLVGGAYLLVRGLDNLTADAKTRASEPQRAIIAEVKTKVADWWISLQGSQPVRADPE